MEPSLTSQTDLNPETLENIRSQVSTLRLAGKNWTQIGHALTEAGLMSKHLSLVHASLGAPQELTPGQRTALSLATQREDPRSLLNDLADCMGSIRKQLADVKPKHYGVLAQIEALETRCRNATRE